MDISGNTLLPSTRPREDSVKTDKSEKSSKKKEPKHITAKVKQKKKTTNIE